MQVVVGILDSITTFLLVNTNYTIQSGWLMTLSSFATPRENILVCLLYLEMTIKLRQYLSKWPIT